MASPPYSVPTDRENALNALAIDKAADLPVMLYNYPHRTGTMMGEEFLDRVGRSRNFCGIKESSGDINRVHLLARDYPAHPAGLRHGRSGAGILCLGCALLGLRRLELPAREHVALYNACVIEGNFAKGRRIMSAMMPLMRVLRTGRQVHPDHQARRHHERHRGRAAMRPPLKGLNKDDKRALEQVVRVLKQKIADIEAEG